MSTAHPTRPRDREMPAVMASSRFSGHQPAAAVAARGRAPSLGVGAGALIAAALLLPGCGLCEQHCPAAMTVRGTLPVAVSDPAELEFEVCRNGSCDTSVLEVAACDDAMSASSTATIHVSDTGLNRTFQVWFPARSDEPLPLGEVYRVKVSDRERAVTLLDKTIVPSSYITSENCGQTCQSAESVVDASTPDPSACLRQAEPSPGEPLVLGPPEPSQGYDLFYSIDPYEDGQQIAIPQSGVVTGVTAALWNDSAPEVVASVYLLCDGWTSLQAEVTLPASSLPSYEPGSTQGGLTSFALEPAVPVVAGDTVVVTFRTTAGRAMSGIYTTDAHPQSEMVFFDCNTDPVDWDMVAQIHLD